MTLRRVRIVAVAAFVAALSIAAIPTATRAANRTVTIDGTAYVPEALSVRRGDTVVWVNKDPFPHTVTMPGSVDSRSIGAGKSRRYHATRPGEYRYGCTLHPNMRGVLRVE